MKKPLSMKGKFSIAKFFQKFSVDDRVVLKAESSYQRGMYFPRFHGKNGLVKGTQGNCYKVLINDSGKKKEVIVHPVHLKKNQ